MNYETSSRFDEQSEDLGPYSYRTNIDAELSTLLSEPEVVLSEEDKQAAFQFGQSLLAGNWNDIHCAAKKPETGQTLSYSEVDKLATVTNSHTFYPDLLRQPNAQPVRQMLGIDKVDEKLWFRTISKRVAAGMSYDLTVLRNTAKDAQKWRSKQLNEALQFPSSHDETYAEPASFTVNFTPEKLLQKSEAWQAYRQYYRQINEELKTQPDSALLHAQRALLNVHRGAVNAKMAILYPPLIDFKRQIEATNLTVETGQWSTRLAAVTPVFNSASKTEIVYPRPVGAYASFLTRLDHIRRGVAVQKDGTIGPISPQLLELEQTSTAQEVASSPDTVAYTPKELDIIHTTRWNSSELKTFLEDVLKSADLLSEQQSEWDEIKTRSGTATDGRWQVTLSPTASSLSVDAKKRIMTVPEQLQNDDNPTRSLGDLLPTSAHEVGHVIQGEVKKQQAAIVPLAEISGRRALVVAEMGGIYEERIMRGYQGETRPVRWYFLHGLQTKLAGGNEAQVARVIYDTMQAANPGQTAAETRHKAVSSTERLYRFGGFNSQPLDYSLQELIVDGLTQYDPKTAKAIALGASAFALLDSAALHRAGVYDVPDPRTIPSSAELVLKVFKNSYLPDLMSKTQ
jgi:hypothetical protein